ncbi:MAG: tRNA adenosine(34) deaminase TadA [Desulfobulbus propionicus]|nr:MAG: tRNA adenosine(34) deaminase TadA [Desulfobulbus propionicus]
MMRRALEYARRAAADGEVPVGAVVVSDRGEVLAGAGNACISNHDPTGHAEMQALREACMRVGNYRLPGAMLYVTLEPCAMCAGAMVHARISRLVYGTADPKTGAVHSLMNIGRDSRLNHIFTVTSGVEGMACAELLQAFFRERRQGQP